MAYPHYLQQISEADGDKQLQEYRTTHARPTSAIIVNPAAFEDIQSKICAYFPAVPLPEPYVWMLAVSPCMTRKNGTAIHNICILPIIVNTDMEDDVHEYLYCKEQNNQFYTLYFSKLMDKIVEQTGGTFIMNEGTSFP